MSEEKKNVYQKLAAARLAFKGEGIKKSGQNKFAGYRYFTLDDILNAATVINDRLGITCVEEFDSEHGELRVVNLDDTKDCVSFTVPMSSAQLKGCHEVQNLGAVISYLRRYLYQNAYSVCEPDDIDSGAYGEPEKMVPKKPEQKPDDGRAYATFLDFVAKESAKNPDKAKRVWASLGVDDLAAIPPSERSRKFGDFKRKMDDPNG